MEVGGRDLITDEINSKLTLLCKEIERPSGARDLKGDKGDKRPFGSRGPTGKRGVEGPEGPPGKICKMGPVGIGARGSVGQQGPTGPQGSTGPRCVQGAKGYVELLVSKVLLECNDLSVLLVDKANVA